MDATSADAHSSAIRAFVATPNECRDGLLWVGRTYSAFLCRKKHSCAIRFGDQALGFGRCFVHEAEWRGVSRRISGHMPWVVPGITRVFVANAPDAGGSCRGLIRGYFVVAQVQRISGFESGDARVDKRVIEELLREETADRIQLKPGQTRPHPEPDDDDEDSECLDGDTRDVPKGATTVPQVCRQGGWQDEPAGEREPSEVPVFAEVCAEHRSCSVRQTPGAFYVVDALCAQATTAFSHRIARSDIRQRFAAASPLQRHKVLDDARCLFDAVVQRVHLRRAQDGWAPPRVPTDMKGKVSVRGELVLFNEPLAYEMHPRVSLRSLERVDGDDVLEHVRAGRSRIRPRICAGRDARHLTEEATVAAIAAKNSLNRSVVAGVLEDLAALVASEAAKSGLAKIPGIASVAVQARKVRFDPYKVFVDGATTTPSPTTSRVQSRPARSPASTR